MLTDIIFVLIFEYSDVEIFISGISSVNINLLDWYIRYLKLIKVWI
jgi:hypothetical protein